MLEYSKCGISLEFMVHSRGGGTGAVETEALKATRSGRCDIVHCAMQHIDMLTISILASFYVVNTLIYPSMRLSF